jgi:hypothetical protein
MRIALALALLSLVGCNEENGAVGDPCTTPGFLCSTPTCYQFPKSPGCTFVAPMNGRCPLDHEHCADPKVSSAYCDPTKGVCGTLLATHPDPCPDFCNQADVAVCYDISTLPVCAGGSDCVAFVNCTMGDGGVDMAQPVDMAATDGSATD